jgi:uncharacterized membrane protein
VISDIGFITAFLASSVEAIEMVTIVVGVGRRGAGARRSSAPARI